MRTHADSPIRPRAATLTSALTLLLALVVVLAPSAAAQRDDPPGQAKRGAPSRSLTVTHGPVVTTLTTAGTDGHQLGDMRVVSIPVTAEDGSGAGRLDASLLTTGIDEPGPGDEIRISTLVFTLGDDPADQVVVTGSGLYPAAGSTIAIDSIIVRPIAGGSGRFGGATGWAESEHLADDSWRHTLHFVASAPGRGRAGPPGLQRVKRPDRERPPGADRAEAGIVRTLLGETEPSTTEGETLGLWHYLIPAGAALAPHTHPGDQIARIVRGTLTYQVVSGEARVVRADGSTETVGAGQVTSLEPGDAVIEPGGMEHFGSNAGRRPVEIVAATLFETGADPSSPMASAAPLASAAPVESPAA